MSRMISDLAQQAPSDRSRDPHHSIPVSMQTTVKLEYCNTKPLQESVGACQSATGWL